MNFILENWQSFAGVIGTIVAYFGGKKLAKINEKQMEASAIETTQNIYDKLVADMDKKFDDLNSLVKKQNDIIKAQDYEIEKLKRELTELKSYRTNFKHNHKTT